MENKLVKASEFGLNEKQVISVDAAFEEKIAERKEISKFYEIIIKQEINPETAQQARNLRLKAVKVKSGVSKIHKTQKAFALAFGKYCDAWKNKEIEPIQQMIDNLIEIEKFEERRKAEEKKALQEKRIKELGFYVEGEIDRDLASMDNEVWNAFFEAKKKEYYDRKEAAKKELEERLERERKEKLHSERKEMILPYFNFWEEELKTADLSNISVEGWENIVKSLKAEKSEFEAEQERIKAENSRLQKEMEAREAKIKAEAAKREAAEKKAAAEREAKAKAEKAAYDTKLKTEREAREKLEREARERAEAEAARLEAEANKGDADKVKDLLADLEGLKTKYTFKSKKNQKMYSDVSNLLDKIIKYVK